MEILGHVIGFIAILFYFWSYQIHDKRKLIAVQTVATALMCLQYILLGAYSGFALNIICIIRNFFFYYRDKKGVSGYFLPIFFACIMAVVSLFSWDGLYSLLIISGLMINTVCMGVCNAQNLRKSVIFTCALIIAYNAFSFAIMGIVSESISIISAVIGIVRYSRAEKEKKALSEP